tara:strand:+ start:814 stop:1197 length:384 start_codon:yes stop_codon:yes gene_type:complete
MITLTLNNIKYLNVSLQIGDMVYARGVLTQPGADDLQQDALNAPTNSSNKVGLLRKINILAGNTIELIIDEVFNFYQPQLGDFIMFSKYDQSMGDVIGYYAEARFKNNSREKAEMFSVGSEIIINSK